MNIEETLTKKGKIAKGFKRVKITYISSANFLQTNKLDTKKMLRHSIIEYSNRSKIIFLNIKLNVGNERKR